MPTFVLLYALRSWIAPLPLEESHATVERVLRDDAAAGFEAYAKRDWQGCTAAFEDVLAAGEPADARLASNLHATLGACYDELERPSEALRHHRRALALDPANAGAWANLGVSRRLAGRYELAEEAYERALRLDPDNAVVHANLGAVQVLRGQPGRAIERLRRAIQLDRRLAAAHANLAVAYARLGRLVEAEAALGAAVELGYAGAAGVKAILAGERARRR